MNSMINLGPISIPSVVLTGFLAFLAGFGAVTTATRKKPEDRKHYNDLLLSGVIIFIVLWKFSPALTDFDAVRNQPSLILFAPTRPVHLVIACAGFVLYTLRVFLKERKDLQLIKIFILFMFVSASVFAAVYYILPAAESAAEEKNSPILKPPTTGDIAPDFSAETIEGSSASVSDYRGTKVILNFWASWCPPCKAEISELIRFHEETTTGAAILSVNMTSSERDLMSVKSFILKEGITYPVLLDLSGELARVYGVTSIPTTFILDEEGTVIRIHSGAVTGKWIESVLPR